MIGDTGRRDEAMRLFDDLEEMTNAGGYSSHDTVRAFREKASRLRMIDLGPSSGYIGTKLSEAVNWVEILYSDRKHHQWDDGTQTGVEKARHFALSALMVDRRNAFVPGLPPLPDDKAAR